MADVEVIKPGAKTRFGYVNDVSHRSQRDGAKKEQAAGIVGFSINEKVDGKQDKKQGKRRMNAHKIEIEGIKNNAEKQTQLGPVGNLQGGNKTGF